MNYTLKKYANLIIEKLKVKYDELGLRATGDYEKSLEAEVNETKMIIWGAFHSQFMEFGRQSGKRPPIPSIMRWLNHKKGLPPSMLKDKRRTAFAIANKIARDGIKVPNQFNQGNVISAVVDDFLANDINKMLDELRIFWGTRIQSDMLEIFETAA